MTFLKMLVTTLAQALTWCGGHQARQFIEIRLRQAGYDDSSIDTAREAVTLLVTALITALMAQMLKILDTLQSRPIRSLRTTHPAPASSRSRGFCFYAFRLIR